MEKLVLLSVENRIAYVTLNRPEKRNALNPELIAELSNVFNELDTNVDVKVVVLKARGDVFSAGADLEYVKQLQANTYEENLEDSDQIKTLFSTIYNSGKPVIAQVEGNAIAGGCGLVSVCDIAFSVPEAFFGYTEVKIGFVPALVSAFLLRRIGEGRTREMLLSGELVDCQTAFRYGLVNFISNKDSIDGEVKLYAEKLADSTSSKSLAITKRLLSKIHGVPLEDALSYSSEINARARLTEDCKTGIEAFLNKKPPKW